MRLRTMFALAAAARHPQIVRRPPETDDLAEIEINGAVIPKGSQVHLVYAAANRDPARWSDPDEFDPFRPLQPHLVFAPLFQHAADAGMRVLHVIHRILFRLAARKVHVEHEFGVGLPRHEKEADGVAPDIVDQLAQGDAERRPLLLPGARSLADLPRWRRARADIPPWPCPPV